MKTSNLYLLKSIKLLIAICISVFSSLTFAAELPSQVDDFTDVNLTNTGFPRIFVNDTMVGGQTTMEASVSDGIVKVIGDIVPARGQPGWATMVIPIATEGQAEDASKYVGISLRVKLNKGNLSLSANSTKVTNFDYHAAQLTVKADGKFHDIKVPFDRMQRVWSEQTKLDTSTLNSLSIVAFSMQPTSFEYEIDQVSFY